VRHRGLREFFEHARGEWDGPRNQQKPRFHGIGQRWVGRYFKLSRHVLSRSARAGQSRIPSATRGGGDLEPRSPYHTQLMFMCEEITDVP